ncbi:aldehyde dehydrogenase family protein [Lentibacillus sp. N15]|uniref:aldehyde dehydrogenase family protein n=1 Tax=Lentibacillus songyuanensis TaxID=3136161 RepID=UPI0031BAA250
MMINKKQLFINGQWINGEGEKRTIINPANERKIIDISEATAKQAEQAAAAARTAFDETDWWINRKKRIQVLYRVADLLGENVNEMAKIETQNTGKPIRESKMDMEDSINCLRYYAKLIESETYRKMDMEDGSVSTIIYEPIGVCSLILPWNFPLLLGMWKIAPALAAGNTVIFKPSEVTPLSMIQFTALLQEAGVPEGVFNLVLGDGETVGKSLISNQNIDKVSFTGGVQTGRNINEACARSFKRISLELGGKSAMIILEEADINKAVEWIMFGGFFNQGEVCVASSRVLIHESLYQKVIDRLRESIGKIRIGDPRLETTEMGPIINKSHLEKVKSYLSVGVREGATLIGGEEIEGLGYYIQPAIFVDVHQEMTVVQEEIFGPVITVQSFKDDKEAVNLANGTQYGLAAGVIGDVDHASAIAAKIKAGTIWINNYHIPYVEAPWGGYKQSGIGRELGPQGLDSFKEIKHINHITQLLKLGWYQFQDKDS